MQEVFQRVGLKPTFHTVNEARLKLTTSAFPYLRAVRAVEVVARPDARLTALEERLAEANGQHRIIREKDLEAARLQRLRNVKRKAIRLSQLKGEDEL